MNPSDPARRPSGHGPTDPGLLDSPLDFISEDHLRERQICAVIDGLAAAASLERQAALTILRFLNEEVNVHLRDEVEELFPLLAQRCMAEDAIESAIARIRVDQIAAMRLLPPIRASLAGCLDSGSDLSSEERAMLTRFAAHMRRHLVAENAILLPIARARLTRADLATLSHHMRARRGLAPDVEKKNAE
ncbi:hemerythrin domain-containing protein [Paracoccus salsus]|uniref:hemerythrin domain-containing protein n=1 Tax=Paracoccus salsus TaxID=2911061 RepID=UPI001F1CF8F2|nr:hemerythrin domain-containing protein [Paracoccus salsus]MCF3974670.1 hemerythrin domain-containing protein [Paracoccus salsus]